MTPTGSASAPLGTGALRAHNARYGADGVLHRYLTGHRYDLEDPTASVVPDAPPPEHVVRPPCWPAAIAGHMQHEATPCPDAARLGPGELDLVWSAAARARSVRPRRAVVIGSSWAYLMAMYGIDDLRQLMVQRGGPISRSTLLLARHGLAGAARARRLAASIPAPGRTTVAVTTAEHAVPELVAAYTTVGARVIAVDLDGGAVAPAVYGPDRWLIRCLATTTVLATEPSAPWWFAAAVGCRTGLLAEPGAGRTGSGRTGSDAATDLDTHDLTHGDEHTRMATARRVLGADAVLPAADLRQLLRWRTS